MKINAKFQENKQAPIPTEGTTYAVTYRLNGSLPVSFILNKKAEYDEKEEAIRLEIQDSMQLDDALLKLQQSNFIEFDQFLDTNTDGVQYLVEPEIAQIIGDSLHFLAKSYFELHAFCIMPNHVHLLLTVLPDAPSLAYILERHKRLTGLMCNKALLLEGNFWTAGCFEHQITNTVSFARNVLYTLNNPVKAGLTLDWREWEHYYCNPDILVRLV